MQHREKTMKDEHTHTHTHTHTEVIYCTQKNTHRTVRVIDGETVKITSEIHPEPSSQHWRSIIIYWKLSFFLFFFFVGVCRGREGERGREDRMRKVCVCGLGS